MKGPDIVRRWFKRITNYLSYVLLVAIVAMIVFVFASNMTGKPIFIAGHSVLWVLTGSMEPEIPAKSYILIEQISPDEVKVGDVIAFYSDDDAIRGMKNTHRVVEIVGDHEQFITKGDNNPVNDDVPARAESLIGVYRRTLPFLSGIGRVLATRIGLILSFTLILVILMLLYLPDMMRITRERQALIEQKHKDAIDELVRQEVQRMKQADLTMEDKAGKDDADV